MTARSLLMMLDYSSVRREVKSPPKPELNRQDAKNAKALVIPTGAKRSGGISQPLVTANWELETGAEPP
jgi:hypothetical protein